MIWVLIRMVDLNALQFYHCYTDGDAIYFNVQDVPENLEYALTFVYV